MRVVIVGFPYSGKTALFTAISGLPPNHHKASEESLASVKVPEPRLQWLAELYKPRKYTEATIDFVDLPGHAEGDSEHAGLEKHLPTLRQADALLMVVRAFANPAVPPHQGRIDPRADVKSLREEMLLADLMICANRIDKLEKSLKKPSKTHDQEKHELAVLERCRAALESEKSLRDLIQPGEEERLLRSFGFLTQKSILVAVNSGEDAIGGEPPSIENVAGVFNICAAVESDIIQLPAEDRPAFMADYHISTLARDRVIRASLNALGMIAFYTVGEDEVRAWPVPRGCIAVDAAGKIHTDLARGFIRAEVVGYDDFRAAGSMRDAKAQGKLRQEPKGYVVQDGDIINIKFSV